MMPPPEVQSLTTIAPHTLAWSGRPTGEPCLLWRARLTYGWLATCYLVRVTRCANVHQGSPIQVGRAFLACRFRSCALRGLPSLIQCMALAIILLVSPCWHAFAALG